MSDEQQIEKIGSARNGLIKWALGDGTDGRISMDLMLAYLRSGGLSDEYIDHAIGMAMSNLRHAYDALKDEREQLRESNNGRGES